MRVYNGIQICCRDDHLIHGCIANLDKLGEPMTHCLYYGTTAETYAGPVPYHIGGFPETYDNLPIKLYDMLRHSLTFPDWTHFFKCDVNATILSVDWPKVWASDYAGCVNGPKSDGTSSVLGNWKLECREPILREDQHGRRPLYWCYGSGYFVSRNLAEEIVSRGAWEVRGHALEDIMVACVAEDMAIKPVQAVSYRDEYGVHPR